MDGKLQEKHWRGSLGEGALNEERSGQKEAADFKGKLLALCSWSKASQGTVSLS
jgi:hypothetical protein